jgi:hypothetical protein
MTSDATRQLIDEIVAANPGLGALRDLSSAVTNGPYYYDRNGDPIKFGEWGVLMQTPSYKIIEQTDVGPWMVSTVWLGLNHNWPGRPIIFETMVFEQEKSLSKPNEWFPNGFEYHRDFDQKRYATEDEARAGHAATIAECEAAIKMAGAIDPRDQSGL